ncbi:MAG: SpaA isopeptide-forming pilin-related protein, partial [Eubacteriales bacterium]
MKKALQVLVVILIVWFALMQVLPGKTAQATDVTKTINFITGVQITNTDGTALSSGVSKDAAIKLNYSFAIANTVDVHNGDTFKLSIPEQIKILSPGAFTINDTDTNTAIAEGTLASDGSIVLTFTDFASKYSNVRGSFWFDLQFNKDQIGTTNPQPIVFNVGGTTPAVTVQVDFEQPAAPNATIQKSGELTAANEITWAVTVDPENVAVNNAHVVDSIASGQEFIPGSVSINGASASASNYTYANGVLTYNFPSTISSQQVLTFKTKVLDSEFTDSTEGATLHESNIATLNHDGGSIASNQPTVDVPVNFIDKSGTYDADNKKIDWTINVDEVNVNIQNAVVTDTLPAGLSLDAASVKLDGAPFTADASASPVITFTLGSLNSPHVITFSTTVDSVIYQSNGSPTYHNEVLLTGTGVPANTTSSDDVKVPSIVIKKVGSAYNPATHEITWQVTINTNHITIENAVVSDPIMPGQEYVNGSATIDNGGDVNAFSYTPADAGDTAKTGTLKYAFASTITNVYVLTFKTAVTDPTIYAGNTPNTYYNNTAYFDGMVGGSSVPTSESTDSAIVFSQVINKSSGDYDHQTHELTWYITVNDNGMPLDGTVVSDVIPAGQEYVENSAEIDGGANVSSFAYNSSSKTLTYTFTGTINKAYNLAFKTKVTDPLFFQTNGDKVFQNTASITDTLVPGGVTSTGSKTIENMVISKGYTYTPGNKYIDWTVDVNTNNLTLISTKLTDQLQEGLDLDTTSVKLFRENINTDGTVTVGAQIALTDANVEYFNATRTFNFTIPTPATGAYLLTFRTDVTDKSKPFTNTVRFDGTGLTQTNSTSDVVVSWADSGSTGTGEVGSIKVYKVDKNDQTKFLPNTVFVLKDKYGNVIDQQTTDANGSALFERLRFDVNYTVEELTPPPGYALDSEPYTFQISGTASNKNITQTFADSPGVGNIQFTKTDGTNPLKDAGFTLYDTANNPVTTASSDVNGVVLFQNIPLGDYTIKETTPPAGFTLSSAVLTVSLTESGKTVLTSPDTLADTPYQGSIQFTKLDSDSQPLAEAIFTLYDSNHNAIKTATSASNGIVTFQNVPIGSYTIRETKAPDGYALNTSVITATITQNGESVTANPAVIVDGINFGTIRITKVSTFGGTPLAGCVFALYLPDDTNFLYPIIPAVTGADGVATFQGVPLGSYIIKELSAPTGYTIGNAVSTVTITQSGQTVIANPAIIADTPFMGNIQVIKTSSDGTTKLSGATFKLYLSSDTSFSNPKATVVSDSNGIALFQNIPYGSYAIRETAAPSGYY